jgi:hypothetical protein
MPGITAMLASTVEQCSLLLPLRWGAGPMAIIIIIMLPNQAIASTPMAMLLWLNW